MLDSKLVEYWKAFHAADQSGNGSLSAPEIQQLFRDLNHPLNDTNLWKIFETYDKASCLVYIFLLQKGRMTILVTCYHHGRHSACF